MLCDLIQPFPDGVDPEDCRVRLCSVESAVCLRQSDLARGDGRLAFRSRAVKHATYPEVIVLAEWCRRDTADHTTIAGKPKWAR